MPTSRVTPSSASVGSSSCPLTGSVLESWNCASAACVFSPKSPFGGPASKAELVQLLLHLRDEPGVGILRGPAGGVGDGLLGMDRGEGAGGDRPQRRHRKDGNDSAPSQSHAGGASKLRADDRGKPANRVESEAFGNVRSRPQKQAHRPDFPRADRADLRHLGHRVLHHHARGTQHRGDGERHGDLGARVRGGAAPAPGPAAPDARRELRSHPVRHGRDAARPARLPHLAAPGRLGCGALQPHRYGRGAARGHPFHPRLQGSGRQLLEERVRAGAAPAEPADVAAAVREPAALRALAQSAHPSGGRVGDSLAHRGRAARRDRGAGPRDLRVPHPDAAVPAAGQGRRGEGQGLLRREPGAVPGGRAREGRVCGALGRGDGGAGIGVATGSAIPVGKRLRPEAAREGAGAQEGAGDRRGRAQGSGELRRGGEARVAGPGQQGRRRRPRLRAARQLRQALRGRPFPDEGGTDLGADRDRVRLSHHPGDRRAEKGRARGAPLQPHPHPGAGRREALRGDARPDRGRAQEGPRGASASARRPTSSRTWSTSSPTA